ncbi:cyclin-F [Hoplias malabaricus]|uniref:cyclin-F n=1 Tax=Hoplias malabaricus TaxID=27720 RepID=UPI0034627B9E
MKAGVPHCRCSKCFSLPARKRVRKQATSLTLLSLPEEVLLCVLQCLSAEDLLSVRAVHSQLRDLIDNSSGVWARVSFKDNWPAPDTVWLFERAAEKGNFEAAVKLGIAHLYNEGPSLGDEGRADLCGRMAAKFFSLAESLRPPVADPFIWVFIRPPWSPSGSCCKAVVFDHLKAECESNPGRRGTLLHCLARVLQLFDGEEKHTEALAMLEESSNCGSVQSSYLLWEQTRSTAMGDPGRYLQCLRTLRDCAMKGCFEAQLSLAKFCATGNPLGLEPRGCADLVSQLFYSNPSSLQRADDLHTQGINDTMRYILVDWLVEVSTMKDFSSLALHVTVGCVDRYLTCRTVAKSKLQLLGIACMVICTRYISKDILTIREAVWLTDNTYQYEDLVRIMGEVISVLEGKIRIPTLLDYGDVLQSLLPMERRSAHLFSYICELTLLCSPFTLPSPAHLACATLLLTRALHNYAPVWPNQLLENTGFSKQELVPCALLLYTKCFIQDAPKDYRDVSLIGVKQRFESHAYQQISKEPVMGLKELCQVLEVPEVKFDPPSASGHSTYLHSFLSPSNNSKRRREDSTHTHRGSFVATPTAELSTQEDSLLDNILDLSLHASCSGYEGDQESEGEKEDESSAIAFPLQLSSEPSDTRQHCCALSSEDSMSEAEAEAEVVSVDSSHNRLRFRQPSSKKGPLCIDLHSSGYSSVQSSSPSTSASSTLLSCSLSLSSVSGSASPGFHLLVPMQRPSDATHKQVKRKNTAAHSGGDIEVKIEEDITVANVSFHS